MKHDIAVILTSSLVALLFWFMAPIYFAPDSEHFYSSAAALVGNHDGKYFYYRSLGYPLVIVASGVIYFKTLFPLLILQMISAIMIPWLVFRTVLYVSSTLAFPCAIVCILSFTPYFLQNLVMTDEISMILMYAAVFFITKYVYLTRQKDILLATFCILLWMMLRPAALLAFIVMIPPLLFLGKKSWKHLVIASICLIIAFNAFNFFTKLVVHQYNKHHTQSEKIEWAPFAGKMFFWNIYGPGSIYAGKDTIKSTNGYYSQKMFDMLLEWAKNNPNEAQAYLKTNDPLKSANEIMTGKTLWFHWILWLAADEMYGPKKADRLFWHVALEGLKTHPKALALFWDGIVEFILSGDVEYNSGKKTVWGSGNGPFTEDVKVEDGYFPKESSIIPKSVVTEIRSSYIKTINFFHYKYYRIPQALFYWGTFCKIAAVIICACLGGTLWASNHKLRIVSSILLLMILYQAAVCALFASPYYRYIVPIIPATIMLAVYCMTSYQLLTKKK